MQFDPYYTWLGIPPDEQPPNHYRLLGLREFEASDDVIAHAADRQMTYIRTLQSGKHGGNSQKILNEIAAARVCLLNGEKKRRYDAELRAQQTSAGVVEPPASAPPPPLPGRKVREAGMASPPPIPSPRPELQEQPVAAPPGVPPAPSSPSAQSSHAGPGPVPVAPAGSGPAESAEAPVEPSTVPAVRPATSHAEPPPVPMGIPVSSSSPEEPGDGPSRVEGATEVPRYTSATDADASLSASEILGAGGARPRPYRSAETATVYLSTAEGLDKLRLSIEETKPPAGSRPARRSANSRLLVPLIVGGGAALALTLLLAIVLISQHTSNPAHSIASSPSAATGRRQNPPQARADESNVDAGMGQRVSIGSGDGDEGSEDATVDTGSPRVADPAVAVGPSSDSGATDEVDPATSGGTSAATTLEIGDAGDDPFSAPATPSAAKVATEDSGGAPAGKPSRSSTAGGAPETSAAVASSGGSRAAATVTAGATNKPAAPSLPSSDPRPSSSSASSPSSPDSVYSGPKRPVPAGEDLRKANELKRDLRKEAEEISFKDLRARLLHAEELLNRGQAEADPVAQYALLDAAYQQAEELSDYPLAKRVLQELTTRFDVDVLEWRTDFVKYFSRKARNRIELHALAVDVMQLADEALEKEKFNEAEALCGMARQLAQKGGDLAMSQEARQKEFRVGEARRAATLKRIESDEGANAAP